MASAKRCHYEVLGLHLDCTADEIRSAYKKLALQRHPDKLVQSGISQADATAQFQELQQAYEVLSDPKERSWYDSHRSQILFSDPSSVNSKSVVPDLFPFFSNTVYSGYSDSGKGFYKVYSDLFNKIYGNEINFTKKLGLRLDLVREAPVMGNLESPYTQVTAFYNYWLGFCTVMDFCWVDEYDVMDGPDRKSRRMIIEENKKQRKKAKREYNETVRGLAEFVKKRDKRVIEMAIKRNLEMERKKEEEREKKKRLEREKLEKLRAYEEPDWAKVEELEEEEEDPGFEEESKKVKELYCVLCSKKFKSEKQWKNHEQSKKHKEKVAEFRESLDDVDDEADGDAEGEAKLLNEDIDNMEERFEECLVVGTEETESGSEDCDVNGADRTEMVTEAFGLDDDDDDNDDDVIEAMVAGIRSRENVASVHQPEASPVKSHVENEINETNPVEYENGRKERKSRRAKKKKGKGNNEDTNGKNYQNDKNNGEETSNLESSSNFLVNKESSDEGGNEFVKEQRSSSKPAEQKVVKQNDTKTKSRHSSKGKKSKATSKDSSNSCETCGEQFESRNKLHMHLGATGHAALKYR